MSSSEEFPPYEEAPTSWLTRRAIQGDGVAREEIIRRMTRPLMAWFGVQLLASRGLGVEAVDCVQEVWMRALSRLGSLDAEAGTIRAWLFGIARNVMNEHRHRALRRNVVAADSEAGEERLDALEDSITRASEVVARSEQHLLLMQLVSTLDTEDALLISWHGLEQRALADVAERLGITREAASKRWQRLKRDLRARGFDLGLFEPDV